MTEPLSKRYRQKEVCIVANGYMWLHQYPLEAHHTVTTMFNANGEIVQWYIDICLQNGMGNGVPWMDDLFLDIVVLPSGEIIHLDADELQNAFISGVITRYQYNLAWNEASKVTELIKNGEFDLLKLANKHKKMLFEKLQ
ncbi:DUF402 domain-containing protein [Virgibacillus sp. L01]|uniref:DUF402 domain-containing protein n=1 Tax=Virgibacillus sp. L01 TaxID=3457429 RepID=UPI003FD3BDA1